MKHYDYIFTGSGLAALLTVNEMILSKEFAHKSILLIDSDLKKTNDRTWCFWEQEIETDTSKNSNIPDHWVSKKWKTALFKNNQFSKELKITPLVYKMIKGVDLYSEIFQLISEQPNINFLNEIVLSYKDLETGCEVKTSNGIYKSDFVFNSIFNPEILSKQSKFPLLQQHFVGWFIKSEEAVFTPNCATFMDFSIAQDGNTRFMYVLPTSTTEALLEYTLFSKDLLAKEIYENGIVNYITDLGISEYEIVEKEYGNVPMTSFEFWKNNSKNLIHIGSAGGWTKASTGYTFKNARKKSKELVAFLLKSAGKENDATNIDFRKFHKKTKFWFYDLLFIDVLYNNNALGTSVFSSLFKKGDVRLIFKFLDEETSFTDDIKVMWKCPKTPFIKALFGRIFNF